MRDHDPNGVRLLVAVGDTGLKWGRPWAPTGGIGRGRPKGAKEGILHRGSFKTRLKYVVYMQLFYLFPNTGCRPLKSTHATRHFLKSDKGTRPFLKFDRATQPFLKFDRVTLPFLIIACDMGTPPPPRHVFYIFTKKNGTNGTKGEWVGGWVGGCGCGCGCGCGWVGVGGGGLPGR